MSCMNNIMRYAMKFIHLSYRWRNISRSHPSSAISLLKQCFEVRARTFPPVSLESLLYLNRGFLSFCEEKKLGASDGTGWNS